MTQILSEIQVPRVEELHLDAQAPPSKSHTNRALIAAALASGRSVLRRSSAQCDDTRLMTDGLRRVGAEIVVEADTITVTGIRRFAPGGTIECGNAGTTLRFLAALTALTPGPFVLDGTERMRERPVADLGMLLEAQGVRVSYPVRNGYPPVAVAGGRLEGGDVQFSSTISSQYLSALLLVAPYAERALRVSIGSLPSRPYLDLTLAIMKLFGAEVERDGYRTISVAQKPYRPAQLDLDGDASGAGYLLAAAAVRGGSARVNGIDSKGGHPDLALLDILAETGCEVTTGDDWLRVQSTAPLKPLHWDVRDTPDLVPTLAALASVARGESRITGIAALRHKESDRVAVIVRELERMGIRATANESELRIAGGEPHAAVIDPEDDHRIAMAFTLLGLVAPGTIIRNPRCVSKSFPRFFSSLGLE